ncbi:MAG: hypothetical protein A2076_07915 [Geobacteraceae bacterium GWC2_53_11]|nr:MAG: hypothetical protein A2076_07915 [Geobacteraceae bacterium GWC2_53_11]
MKTFINVPVLAAVTLCLASLLSGCSSGSSSSTNDKTLPTPKSVFANITSNTTWSSSNVYIIENTISTSSTLTIEPGTVIKFKQGTSLYTMPGGAIVADATSAATPIIFTSIKDDAYGGDTNGDAAATVSAKGDWGYIRITTNGSVFNNCRIMYGGSAKPYTGALAVGDPNVDPVVTITNTTFAHNQGGTLSDIRAAALNLGGAAAGSIVTGNTFYDNDIPMVINGLVTIDNSNLFHASVNGSTVTNTQNGIFMDGVNHAVTGNVTWSNTDVAYVINNNTVLGIGDSSPTGAAAGASLTLADNVILKFYGGRIDLYQYGTLNQGTGNFFTSLNDNALSGVSNGDPASTPVKGDWPGINLCTPLCSWANWSNILNATHP